MFGSGQIAAPLIMALTIGISLLGLFKMPKIIDVCLFRPYHFHRKPEYETMILSGFVHADMAHLFFNMFALWMFGLPVEKIWGSKRFVSYYLICVLGAGLIQLLVQHLSGNIYPTIGASGAVFGLLLAYGVMWPNNKLILIFFPIPIKAKWFVLIYGGAELVFGVTGAMPQVAHYAHLGGLFFGAGLLWRWGWRPGMTWN